MVAMARVLNLSLIYILDLRVLSDFVYDKFVLDK